MECTFLCLVSDSSPISYSVRERLKEVLRQYELRERHFECVIRSKELEVLLSRARAAEQKQLAEGEKTRAEKRAEEVRCPSVLFTCSIHPYNRSNSSGRILKTRRTARPCSLTN
jgi:predicted Holliday junction resolvase-like endonuclease